MEALTYILIGLFVLFIYGTEARYGWLDKLAKIGNKSQKVKGTQMIKKKYKVTGDLLHSICRTSKMRGRSGQQLADNGAFCYGSGPLKPFPHKYKVIRNEETVSKSVVQNDSELVFEGYCIDEKLILGRDFNGYYQNDNDICYFIETLENYLFKQKIRNYIWPFGFLIPASTANGFRENGNDDDLLECFWGVWAWKWCRTGQ